MTERMADGAGNARNRRAFRPRTTSRPVRVPLGLGSGPERPSESILELRRGWNGGTRAMTSDLIDVFRDVAIAVQSVLNATRDCCADITRAAARLDRDDYDLADDQIL